MLYLDSFSSVNVFSQSRKGTTIDAVTRAGYGSWFRLGYNVLSLFIHKFRQ